MVVKKLSRFVTDRLEWLGRKANKIFDKIVNVDNPPKIYLPIFHKYKQINLFEKICVILLKSLSNNDIDYCKFWISVIFVT